MTSLWFPSIFKSLDNTLQYFERWRIREQIEAISGKDTRSGLMDTYHEITLQSHEYMDKEITQHGFGSLPEIQMDMFYYLSEWLKDWRLCPGYELYIEGIIDNYNDEIISQYSKEIEEDEAKFRMKVDYKIGHGEEYEVTKPFYGGGFGMGFGFSSTSKVVKVKNMWFYENKKDPRLIDKNYLPDYIIFLKGIVENFRSIVKKHIDIYEEKKKLGLFARSSYIPQLVTANTPVELPPIKEAQSETKSAKQIRIKVNVTNRELVYLFNTLRDHKIIDKISNTDIAIFVENNISTRTSDKPAQKDIQNNFGEIDKAAADTWEVHFKNLLIAAKKF